MTIRMRRISTNSIIDLCLYGYLPMVANTGAEKINKDIILSIKLLKNLIIFLHNVNLIFDIKYYNTI